MTVRSFAPPLLFAGVIGCGGATRPSGGSTASEGVGAGSAASSTAGTATSQGGASASNACTWPSSLDTDGGGGCYAARVLVSCTDSSGAGCGCTTSGSLTCEGCDHGPGMTCIDQCAAAEYVVSCGGIGPTGGNTNPPAVCRFVGAVPAGIAYYCCPCSSSSADASSPACPFPSDAGLVQLSATAGTYTTNAACNTGDICAFQPPSNGLGWSDFSCECVSGAWVCTIVGGGL